jgi:hypothetical protein
MPATQSYSDAVLNVLRGTGIKGVWPYLGWFSVAFADDSSAGTELAGNGNPRRQSSNSRLPAWPLGVNSCSTCGLQNEAVSFAVADDAVYRLRRHGTITLDGSSERLLEQGARSSCNVYCVHPLPAAVNEVSTNGRRFEAVWYRRRG